MKINLGGKGGSFGINELCRITQTHKKICVEKVRLTALERNKKAFFQEAIKGLIPIDSQKKALQKKI